MPTVNIRWADNTAELKANLAQGLNQIEATRASAEKLVQAFQGGRLAESANKWAAAISEIGGATKLTAAEQERANAIFDKYIEKQTALGRVVPTAVTALNDEIKAMIAARDAASNTDTATGSAADAFQALKGAIESPASAAQAFAGQFSSGVLEPLGEFGIVAGAAAAVAGVVGASLVALAAHARETAASIHDIYEVTGMSVPAVSNLKFALESAGGSFDQINGALFQFEQRMENNSDKVDKGLKMIGLSLAQIRDMSADQRLLAISDALRNTGDETNKAAVAMDIFGKQGRDMLPLLLKPLDELTEKAKTLGLTMSTEDAAAAEEFSLRLNSLKAQADATWTALGLHVSIADYVTLAYDRMKLAVANVAYAFGSTVTSIATLNQYLPAAFQTLRGTVGDLPQVSGEAKKGIDALGASVKGLEFKPVALEGEALSRAEKELEESAKGLIKQEQEQQKEAEKTRQFYANLSSSVTDLSGAQIEAIKYYQAQGVSVSDTAKALGIYQHQVELVVASEKQGAEALKALGEAQAEAQKKWVEEQKKLDDEADAAYMKNNAILITAVQQTADAMAKASETSFDYQRRQVDEWQNQMEGAIDYTQDNWKEAYDAIAAQAKEKLDEIQQAADLADVKVKWEFVGPDKPAFNAMTASLGENLTHSLGTSFAGIPNTLVRALEGGGGMKGAAQSIGSQLGGDITESLGNSLAKTLGGKLGSMLGGIIGPLGSLLGPAISALFGIGGPSKQELAGRDTEKQFEGQFSGFDDMMAKVGAAYMATGRTAAQAQADVKAMFDAEKQGAEATAAAVKKINDVLEQQKKLGEDATAATTGIGGFLGTNTGAMDASAKDNAELVDLNRQLQGAAPGSAQYDAIRKQIEQINEDLKTQASIIDATAVKTQDEATAMGAAIVGSFDLAIQSGKSFSDALKENQPAIEALRAELDKAGLDGGAAFNMLTRQIDLMKDPIAGPVLNAVNNLSAGFKGLAASGTETAQEFQGFGSQVKQAFDKLVAQGKSAPEIMLAMQGPLQELWEEEQQYGFKLDDATQALLDQAVASGEVGEKHKSTSQQMLDAENKLVDVMTKMAVAMGVTFPAAVDSGVDQAKSKIGDLGNVINDLPTSKTFTLDVQQNGDISVPDVPAAATGAEVGYGRLLPFARYMNFGGVVPDKPDYYAAGRLVAFVPRGTDTVPAMLTPRELVINEVQTGAVGRTLETAQSMAQMLIANITAGQSSISGDGDQHIHLYVDGHEVANTVITRAERNTRGIGDRLVRVAGR